MNEEIEELKLYLRLDADTGELEQLLATAKEYIETSTGKRYDPDKNIMRLCAKILAAHWYENRAIDGKQGQEYSYSVTALLTQIQQNPDFEAVADV